MGNSLNDMQQAPLLTPELRQAITILRMTTADLIRYIENALLENPMLEIAEDVDAVEEPSPKPDQDEFTVDWCTLLAECGQIDCSLDHSWGQPEDPFPNSTEHCLAQAPTLHEHLTAQLHLARPASTIREIASCLIRTVDDRGYLPGDLREVRKACSCTFDDMERAVRLVQSFDPPGVGGRNTSECLLLQLERRGLKNSIMEKLVAYFLKGLTDAQCPRIARSMGLTLEEALARCELIRSLDPAPGAGFTRPGEPRYIIPDVVVERLADEFLVLVNDLSVPRLAVNRTYQALLAQRDTCDRHDAEFLEEKLQAAVWLIRSIEQRRAILHRVAQLIVESQEDFLNGGLKYLQPMNLEEIARVVGLHESTVNRAIANKVVQTPHGVFYLKLFFSFQEPGCGTGKRRRKR